ncbi:hypothetical protein BT63DRAFT_473918 [Microthyrium microscopicum]|uniref:Uncharacterized protein n=1 Tax=Microthyrium microscopicum TaxID=703497 RepID=A0A6A6UT82_9PEZI|nr:hypothetical protein BT63DRAFT_473918 [Microthyrium microscopicum]
MASDNQPNNIWNLMNYIPPRGQCNNKDGILVSRCQCQRFMLNPLKAATSYDCDGCGHHASFHILENKVEEEILKKWKTEAAMTQALNESNPRPKKRPRAIQSRVVEEVISVESESETVAGAIGATRSRRRGAGN